MASSTLSGNLPWQPDRGLNAGFPGHGPIEVNPVMPCCERGGIIPQHMHTEELCHKEPGTDPNVPLPANNIQIALYLAMWQSVPLFSKGGTPRTGRVGVAIANCMHSTWHCNEAAGTTRG